MSAPSLRDVRRGTEPDELLLVGSDHRTIIVRGYGLTADERVRMAEAALALLRETLARTAQEAPER